MAEKDTTEKVLLSIDEVFADVINVFAFHGDQVISPTDLRNDVVMTTYDHADQLRSRECDVSKFWVKGGVRILLSGIANHSAADGDMPLRVIGNDSASYRGQLADSSKESARYPVMTVVLYFGEQEWDKPKNLLGCFDNWNKIPDAMKPLIQDYRIHVFDIPRMNPEDVELFRSDFRVVADYFVQKHRNHRYQPRRGKMKYVKQVCDLLAAATGDRHFVDKYNIIAQAKEGGPDDMCEIVEQFIEEGKSIGRAEGKAEGRAEGKAEGRAEGELNAMFKLVSQDLLPAQIAAEQIGLTVEEFNAKLNDYLSKAKKD